MQVNNEQQYIKTSLKHTSFPHSQIKIVEEFFFVTIWQIFSARKKYCLKENFRCFRLKHQNHCIIRGYKNLKRIVNIYIVDAA